MSYQAAVFSCVRSENQTEVKLNIQETKYLKEIIRQLVLTLDHRKVRQTHRKILNFKNLFEDSYL